MSHGYTAASAKAEICYIFILRRRDHERTIQPSRDEGAIQ
jgi:hypothetical protein